MSESERLDELRRFLRARRAQLRPQDVGLPTTSRRRVRGLRREEVASLAGIGVSWYTALENGDARGVSDGTLDAVAGALRLSGSEREYLMALVRRPSGRDESAPSALVLATMRASAFPSYIITATWQVVACNDAFRRVWAIGEDEVPFNAVDRLFLHPAARKMHGAHFAANIAPVVAMLHSSQGRQPDAAGLRQLRDRLLTDETIRRMWDAYAIASPLLPNTCTIQSPLGTFGYEALTLPIPGRSHGIVVQVPDEASIALLRA